MRIVQPKVILLAETKLVDLHYGPDNLPTDPWSDFREAVGAPQWSTDARAEGEGLIEAAGRMCYRSWAPGLNPNVTKVREGNRSYIGNILAQKHGSILEHVNTTWAFLNVSRVFTHELCRHRAGTAVSQESLRYVRLENLPMVHSDELPDDGMEVAGKVMETWQNMLAEQFGLDQSKDFAYKKRKTSAMRRIAPLGLATNMIWTCNLRELRHVITLRTDSSAEEEIRKVIGMLAEMAIPRYPAVFQDFHKKEDGSWEPENWKV